MADGRTRETCLTRRVRDEILSWPVVVFAKGSKEYPLQAETAAAVHLLDHLGVDFRIVDVIAEPSLEAALREVSGWPRLPQVFVRGALVGDADILREIYLTGELNDLLYEKGIPAGSYTDRLKKGME
ncbi:MAG: glutaredoxin domain-containing protein [Pseudomonadota bacterium]|nr:glutaredoxin domain-containing protein [Pseudomonadota bacterium]